MAVLAPMPSAIDASAIAENTGERARPRSAYLRSRPRCRISPLDGSPARRVDCGRGSAFTRTFMSSTMSIDRVNGPDDPRIADYASVPDAELVRRHGLFVAEGRLVVRRLIEEGRYRVRSMLLSEAALRGLRPIVTRVDAPIYVCDNESLRRITGYNVHRGCLALAERPEPMPARDVLAAARMVVVLEAVANPDNVGGVFRNAAAFGFDGVLLNPTCCDPLYRKAIRTSM